MLAYQRVNIFKSQSERICPKSSPKLPLFLFHLLLASVSSCFPLSSMSFHGKRLQVRHKVFAFRKLGHFPKNSGETFRWDQCILVGGFNASEKYQSKWESSPNTGENKKSLKPTPRFTYMYQKDQLNLGGPHEID